MSELLRVVAEPTDVEVDLNGKATTISVHVFNLSTIIDGYLIDAPGAPPWLQVEPADVRLLPGTDGTADVAVSVPYADGVPAHDTTVRLRIRSMADPTVARTVHLTVRVPETAADVGLTLEPEMLRGQQATSRLTVHNRAGNVPVALQLRGSDPEGVVRFQFAPSGMRLEPGQTAQADVHVTAPPVRAGGSEQRRQLTITAVDGQRTYTASGVLVQQPPPTREPLPIRGILRFALTLLGAALIFAGTFMPWLGSVSGAELTLTGTCASLSNPFNLDCGQLPTFPDALPPLLVSAGLITVLLAIAAGLGAIGTGGLTRLAGVAAVGFILLVVFVFTIAGVPFNLGIGAIVVIAGGVLATIGGVLARPS